MQKIKLTAILTATILITFVLAFATSTQPTQAQVSPVRDPSDLMAFPNWPYMSSIVLSGYDFTTHDAMVAAGVISEPSTQSGPGIHAYQVSNPIVLPTNIFHDQLSDFIQVAYATPVQNFGVDVLADDNTNDSQRDEVSISLDPTNSNNLVSVSHRVSLGPFVVRCEFSSSTDGGASWGNDGVLSDPLLPPGGFEGDPTVTSDSTGNFYYACLGFATGFNNLIVQKSVNGGVTWTNPATAGAAVLDDGVDFHDKPWIAADQDPFGTSPCTDNLYLSWSEFTGAGPVLILFKRSTDGGVTWSPEITINGGFNQMSYPFVDPKNGDVYVIFLEAGLGVGGVFRIMIARSTDCGASFGTPTVVDNDMEDKFFEFIDENLGRAREPPQVQGCVTGEGDVLAVWRDFTSTTSTDSDVHYSNSADSGATWTAEVVVNAVIGGDQFFPSIHCQTDQAHISWGDQRFDDTPVDTGLFDVFYRSVTPGFPAPAFGLELRVTDFTQDATVPGSNLFFEPIAGDYFDSVTSDKTFHTIWTDFRTPDPILPGSRFVDNGIKIILATTPPVITAFLVPICGEDDEGLFRVEFSATDENLASVTAQLNGIAVSDGQEVKLELDDDEEESEFEDGILEIEASSFSLVVTANDSEGNSASLVVIPSFSDLEECEGEEEEEEEEEQEE